MALHSLRESLSTRSKKLTFAELLYRIGVCVSACVPVPVSIQSLRGGVLTLVVGSHLEGSEVRLRLGTLRERLKEEFPSIAIDHILISVRSN